MLYAAEDVAPWNVRLIVDMGTVCITMRWSFAQRSVERVRETRQKGPNSWRHPCRWRLSGSRVRVKAFSADSEMPQSISQDGVSPTDDLVRILNHHDQLSPKAWWEYTFHKLLLREDYFLKMQAWFTV